GQWATHTLANTDRMRRALCSGAVKLAVLPFDSPPDARTVIQAAREAGTPTLVIQHGFFAEPNEPDWTLADAVAVWSDTGTADLRARLRGTATRTGNPGVDAARMLRPPAGLRGTGNTMVLVEYPSHL